MKASALLLAGALVVASFPAAARSPLHHPHVSVGLGFGAPLHYYAPYAYDPWFYPYAVAPYPVPAPDKPAANLYVYPEAGQTAQQVTQDRTECRSWAVEQSNFDPLTAKRQKDADLANYDRAFTACMEGRSYSVE